jgi:hypothetical protein
MNHNPFLFLFVAPALAGAALAQNQGDLLVTYSQPEATISGSGGTVLQNLRPNEIALLEYSTSPCPTSAEKWLPRTAAHVMAGDENADGTYFNPGIFGRIDALLSTSMTGTPVGGPANQRTVFWSVSAPMGNNVSATPFRPGDVARIVRIGLGDGQVQHFMRQEHFNQALGLPVATPIDVDAIAWSPNFGVFFSLDQDVVANTVCGPALLRDGDVLCVPPWALTYTPDMRVNTVAPMSVVVAYTEAQMDAMTVNAQVNDRFGVCLNNVVDVEGLEIDLFGPVIGVPTTCGVAIQVPTLIYSCETGTGASLLTTQFGGQIFMTPCGPAGTPCGGGPTWGPQLGVRAPTAVGVPSFVNAVSFTRTCRHVLEPQQHVLNVFPAGAPAGSTMIDYGSPFAFNLALIELAPPVVPPSFPAFPFSLLCFPDLYAPSVIIHAWPLPGPWGSFPMIAIPPNWQGKVIYQNVGFGGSGFELSTPTVIDVQ